MRSHHAPYIMAPTHPASILRAPHSEAREQQRREFVRDLRKVAELIHAGRASAA
jgi:uracil-DNA glycosylase